SGCGVANALAERAARDPKYRGNIIKYANLGGYIPSEYVQSHIPTICYTATSGRTLERNYGSMIRCNRHRVLSNSNCDNSLCLHYGLAYFGVTDGNHYGTGGANLAWLPECSSQIADQIRTVPPAPVSV